MNTEATLERYVMGKASAYEVVSTLRNTKGIPIVTNTVIDDEIPYPRKDTWEEIEAWYVMHKLDDEQYLELHEARIPGRG